MHSNEEYLVRDLVKVNDNGKIKYYAVTSKTADNMLNIDYSRMNNPELRNITVEFIGDVLVEQEL